ncbi:HlyC/CorC family transporter [Simiduia aestuariiviva]|uniref:Mg2+/Co2+ transporter CorB n=1 Tax=Simiduia aestuariiviva TaxID=1510459 RepID=A0A839US73_9GAMM|nr:HlyC/CorC family transporter [Simiduia aestuariiviva]MBB3168235.1 Mg2+/Co2+ transporter CorB [Simiduia aestuariiviva]
MNDIPLSLLFSSLAGLILLSAFFSSSETGMMSLNRYRLKHLVNKKHRGALRAAELLARPDRLIGVILIGNNLVNAAAATIATLIATRLLGDIGLALAPVALTLLLLVFAEVTPKTVAALHPERIAFPASFLLKPLLILFYPIVILVNVVSNALARLLGVNPEAHNTNEHLHPDELRTVVDEAGDLIPDQHQGMLLNVLDLGKATVEDIMVPRNDVVGLNLEDDIPTLLRQIRTSEYTRLPVYEGDINNVVGTLHLRNAARFIFGDDSTITHADIRRFCRKPYFVPESTPLHTQLLHYQKEKRRMAFVVDEYGDVQGIITLEDLLEEIVGDFTTNRAEELGEEISDVGDGWFIIDGSTSLRDVNRELEWDLPTDEAKTINGLLVDTFQGVPECAMSLTLRNYRFEIMQTSSKMIERVKATRLPELDD